MFPFRFQLPQNTEIQFFLSARGKNGSLVHEFLNTQ